jgi:predicted branched-subunit amino acid permease
MSLEPPDDFETPQWRWFLRGLAGVMSVPALILMAAFVGFAGLARESGIGLWEAVFMAAAVWALPSLVIIAGAAAAGTSLLATTIAVALSSVRLMPMVLSLLPILRTDRTKPITLYVLAHFVAVTAWVYGMTHLPTLPRNGRAAYFGGFGLALIAGCCLIVVVTYIAAPALPRGVAAGLTFLTPVYFTLSLWTAARAPSDRFALIFGIVAAPFFHAIEPQFDLLWTGLVGGLLAYGIGKLIKRRHASSTDSPSPEDVN